MLGAELQRYFPYKEAFVPNIIQVVEIWVLCLTNKLEDDANSIWSDKLLEYVGHSGRNSLRAKAEVCLIVFAYPLARSRLGFLLTR